MNSRKPVELTIFIHRSEAYETIAATLYRHPPVDGDTDDCTAYRTYKSGENRFHVIMKNISLPDETVIGFLNLWKRGQWKRTTLNKLAYGSDEPMPLKKQGKR